MFFNRSLFDWGVLIWGTIGLRSLFISSKTLSGFCWHKSHTNRRSMMEFGALISLKQKSLTQWCPLQAQSHFPPIKSQVHISYKQHNPAGSQEKALPPSFSLKQWLWLYPLLFQRETRVLSIKSNYFRLQFNIYETGRAHSR